jgi:menaquinone-dependent protoporphyrinogen oxidase
MSILVAYASKHGSTQGIAERIAEQLRQLGKQAEARPVRAVEDLGSYEALVIGSAVYYGSWLKEATEWVPRAPIRRSPCCSSRSYAPCGDCRTRICTTG